VVEHLRDRARESGIAVVASIHQPRAAVWACFDACAVLSGGFSLYHGPCSDLIGWFQGHLVSRLAWTLGWGLPFGYTLNPPVAGVVGLDLALARQPVSPAAHLCVPF
jgi:hypothetical protein